MNRTRDLALGRFEEEDDYKKGYLAECKICKKGFTVHPFPTTLPKWMICKNGYISVSYYTPKMDVLPKNFLQSILAAKSLEPHCMRPPTSSDDLCLPFCVILIQWMIPIWAASSARVRAANRPAIPPPTTTTLLLSAVGLMLMLQLLILLL